LFKPIYFKLNVLETTKETLFTSIFYLATFFITFEVFMPIQSRAFPDYSSHASLIFLPHGVRVIAAWLLGWRSVIALLPGVFLAYYYLAGASVFELSRLIGIAVAVAVAPFLFYLASALGWDVAPRSDRKPSWSSIMIIGGLAAVVSSTLTNLAFGSTATEYFAYLIGDISGLFFLMLFLMYSFRALRR
jgi:hypothetical protein